MVLLAFIQNVTLIRFYNRSRYILYRSIQKVPWKYVIGLTIGTPFIAIIQGTYLLHDYRRNHGDAPMPDVPSRGLVVVKRQSNPNNSSNNSLLYTEETSPGITVHSSPLKRFSTLSTVQTTIRNSQLSRTANASTTTAINDDSHTAAQTTLTCCGRELNKNRNDMNEYFNDGDHNDDDDDEDANTMVTTNTRPLRILIIGDSLAAGVGTSRSSTPILPETIAQALSKALGGRAVMWTCFGVPGQTSSEIVHSIQNLEDIFISTTKNHTTLLQRFNEWQVTQRQLAQSRIESAKRKTKAWIEHRNHITVDYDGNESTSTSQNSSDVTGKPSNRLVRWWKRTRTQFQNDVQTLRTILKRDDNDARLTTDDDSNTDTNNLTSGDATKTMSLSEQALMISEYDIAIVLTGLNDLKENFLPFMRSNERTKELKQLQKQNEQASMTNDNNKDDEEMGSPTFNDIMRGELLRILNALLDRRMHKRSSSVTANTASIDDSENPERKSHKVINDKDNANHIDHSPEQHQHQHHNKGPLIVFPALPYQPTILSQCPPLSWFIIPLLDMVDANKKMLSELYPGLVLFVESPDIHDWSDATLAQRGTVWEDFFVLFKLNDIAQDANERIIQLMKTYSARWMIRDGDNNSRELSTGRTRDDDIISNDADIDPMMHSSLSQSDDDCLYDWDMMGNVIIRKSPPSISLGSLMVSADGIHPSDIGYDMWGRHIADAIIKEWEKVG